MICIIKEERRTEYQWPKGGDVSHHEDALGKLISHTEAAMQKEGETLISEIPTNKWLKRYIEDMRGCTPHGAKYLETYRKVDQWRKKPRFLKCRVGVR